MEDSVTFISGSRKIRANYRALKANFEFLNFASSLGICTRVAKYRVVKKWRTLYNLKSLKSCLFRLTYRANRNFNGNYMQFLLLLSNVLKSYKKSIYCQSKFLLARGCILGLSRLCHRHNKIPMSCKRLESCVSLESSDEKNEILSSGYRPLKFPAFK